METKHRKGDFLLSADFLNTDSGSLENQCFVAVAMTGTKEKFETLVNILKLGAESFVPGIIGLLQFEDAGQAYEPVSHDCVHLMLGKQEGQRELLLQRFENEESFRMQYLGKKLLLSSNDINTTVEDLPLTKSPLQKEAKLDIFEYNNLITASLKYLAMKRDGIKLPFTWKQMQSDWNLIEKCLDQKYDNRVFLPIDYQAIDAFDLQELVVEDRKHSFVKRGPTIAVINRAYATVELDFRKGNSTVNEIVGNYLSDNWWKNDFTPDRYPLGIQQKSLLGAFAKAGQHVLISDHLACNGINLKEVPPIEQQLVQDTLERIEMMMNGFNHDSVDIARRKYANMKPYEKDYLFVVTRKPGQSDRVDRRLLPRWKN